MISEICALVGRVASLRVKKWLEGVSVAPFGSDRELLTLAAQCAARVTRWQLEVANALARLHCHAWAVEPTSFAEVFGGAGEFFIIDVFEVTSKYVDNGGEMFPRVDPEGNISHRTHSGRLEWVVSDQELTLLVHRPAGRAFSLTLTASGRAYYDTEVEFHQYHVQTACAAAQAVVDAGLVPASEEISAVLAEISAKSLPNPE